MASFRSEELSSLMDLGLQPVGRVIMVLGPPLSGKTSILKEFQSICNTQEPVQLFQMCCPIAGSKLSDLQRAVEDIQQRNSVASLILLIDDAHQLARYQARELIQSLKLLASERKASVIMATMCDLFREEYIGDDVEVVCVRYFSEMQARTFCNSIGRSHRLEWGLLRNEQWSKIYRVCGGCPLLLADAAKALTDDQSLEQALGGMVDETRVCILTGVTEKSKWEVAKFREVMQLMTSAEDGIVAWEDVCESVFGGDETQLREMQKGFVLHVQYAPAGDGSDRFAKFVMPVSPPLWEAMRQYLAGEESEDD